LVSIIEGVARIGAQVSSRGAPYIQLYIGRFAAPEIKDGFGQLTAIGVVGKTAWGAESKFALRNDPNNKDPGPWVNTPVTLP
jgi:hypothetical protein